MAFKTSLADEKAILRRPVDQVAGRTVLGGLPLDSSPEFSPFGQTFPFLIIQSTSKKDRRGGG